MPQFVFVRENSGARKPSGRTPMNRLKNAAILLSTLALVATMATSSVRAQDDDAPRTDTNDAAAVMAAMAQFYTALNALFEGDAAPMSEVWSHAEDVSYMGPGGGMKHGWKEVSAHWKAQSSRNLGGEIRSAREKAILGSKLAIIYAQEEGSHMDDDGQEQTFSLRATNVFRKEDGQWKMIGHHTDIFSSPEE